MKFSSWRRLFQGFEEQRVLRSTAAARRLLLDQRRGLRGLRHPEAHQCLSVQLPRHLRVRDPDLRKVHARLLKSLHRRRHLPELGPDEPLV